MSVGLRLRCERCTSYRVERQAGPRPRWLTRMLNWTPGAGAEVPGPGVYNCQACGHAFRVDDVEAYCRAQPQSRDRCRQCDEPRLELVARDAPTREAPSQERADIYRCAACGSLHHWITHEDPHALY